MYVYSTPPIDFWDGWLSFRDELAKRVVWERQNPGKSSEPGTLVCGADYESIGKAEGMGSAALEELLYRAMHIAARNHGWEGDIRDGPYIAGVPEGEYCSSVMVAWKQDNNGTTFIGSPVRLPWLEGQS
ncbi:MAG: hypothetical protein HQL67_12440 [Magnetococcales bacterium]|nr:hypothetical protein [Magnetococcales bacterium]